MRQKPSLLLLDAGAVIGAFACGGWTQLCEAYEIVIPRLVVDESIYFRDVDGRTIAIDLNPYIANGSVDRYEADASEFALTREILHPFILDRLHHGELEALTYLRLREEKSAIGFISADGVAIQATHAFDAAECALSLDVALKRCGITKNLEWRYSAEFVRKHLAEGEKLLIQGLLRVGS